MCVENPLHDGAGERRQPQHLKVAGNAKRPGDSKADAILGCNVGNNDPHRGEDTIGELLGAHTRSKVTREGLRAV